MKRLPSGKYQDYIYLGKDENGKEIRRYAERQHAQAARTEADRAPAPVRPRREIIA
jgi:hypothetical protein